MSDIALAEQYSEGQPSGVRAARKWPSWKLEPPPEGDPGVGPWVWGKLMLMYRYRQQLGIDDVLRHNHELYRSRLFKNKSKYPQVPVNLFFKTINTLKSNLTDNKPRASIQSRGEASMLAANAWQAAYDQWWDFNKQQGVLQESVGQSELYGYQVDKMVFNTDLEGGVGEVDTILCDSFAILLWPKCMNIQKMPMIGHLEAIELGEIYRRWPASEGKVKADPNLSDKLAEGRANVRANRSREVRPQWSGRGPGTFQPIEADSDGQASEISRALVGELWVKDYTMQWVNPATGKRTLKRPSPKDLEYPETVPAIDPTTGQPLMGTDGLPATTKVTRTAEPYLESKYPGFIRCIHVTNGGRIVLGDVPNPSINPELPREKAAECYLWDKFPFIKRLSYSDGLSEFGLSIIEQIEPLVIEISKKITKVAAHLDVAALPPLILPKNCGVAKKDVNNLPDRIWEPIAAFANAIRFLQLPPLPQDYNIYIQLLIRLVDIITGLTDVSEGRKPGGIVAGTAIASLQEKAQVIFREKIRNLDLYLEEQGRMFISLGQNWYTTERRLKYFGEQGPQEIDFKGTDDQFAGELAFAVEAGSTLPTNKWALRQEYLQLYQVKAIDAPALLELFNIPKRDEIISRMNQGPMRIAFNRILQANVIPPETLDALTKIVALPEKEFEKLFPQAKPIAITVDAMRKAGMPVPPGGMGPKAEEQADPFARQAPSVQHKFAQSINPGQTTRYEGDSH